MFYLAFWAPYDLAMGAPQNPKYDDVDDNGTAVLGRSPSLAADSLQGTLVVAYVVDSGVIIVMREATGLSSVFKRSRSMRHVVGPHVANITVDCTATS